MFSKLFTGLCSVCTIAHNFFLVNLLKTECFMCRFKSANQFVCEIHTARLIFMQTNGTLNVVIWNKPVKRIVCMKYEISPHSYYSHLLSGTHRSVTVSVCRRLKKDGLRVPATAFDDHRRPVYFVPFTTRPLF